MTIFWDDERHFQLAQWTGEYLGDRIREELDRALAEFINLQKLYADAAWLADIRELEVINAENQKWCDNDWFPRFLATGITLMAIVTPKSVIAKMSVEAVVSQVPMTNLTIRYCPTIDAAAAWLERARRGQKD